MREIRLSPRANRDLRELVAWLRKHRSEEIAQAVLDTLATEINALAAFPEAWKRVNSGSRFRSRPLPKLRYAIIYRVTARFIHVAAIAHMRREPGYWRRDE